MKWISFVPAAALVFSFAVGLVIGIYSLGRMVYFGLTLPKHKRPELPWSAVPWGAQYNPFNIALSPSCLTEQGVRNLKEFWRSSILFAISVLLPFVAAYVAGVPYNHAL